jgi:hypothetical protein
VRWRISSEFASLRPLSRLTSLVLALAAPVGAIGVMLAAPACKRADMASSAQCERLLERFIDLKLSEDPRAPTMTSEDRARRRAQIATQVLSDADVQQVKSQCQTEVTIQEYKCAVAAPTSKAWNDCIQ